MGCFEGTEYVLELVSILYGFVGQNCPNSDCIKDGKHREENVIQSVQPTKHKAKLCHTALAVFV